VGGMFEFPDHDENSWGSFHPNETLSANHFSCRFLSKAIAEKYDLDLPEYQGIDQIVEIGGQSQKVHSRFSTPETPD
jgi:hypothetical protein